MQASASPMQPGKNTVTESINNIPWALDWVVQSTVEKKSYLGALVQVGYNFFLMHKRITLGLSEAMRLYSGLPIQYYTNLNIGYNFGKRSDSIAVLKRMCGSS
jgi:hypothetical protein